MLREISELFSEEEELFITEESQSWEDNGKNMLLNTREELNLWPLN